jgi:hypothetical protein
MNDERCILTDWEHSLMKQDLKTEDTFIKSFLRFIFKYQLPGDNAIQAGIYAVCWSCLSISVLRVALAWFTVSK